jgi:thiamine biosynthesis protein ThiS
MKITVNGKSEETPSVTIQDLVEEKKINAEYVIVERNGRIIKRSEWKDVQLDEEDRIEFLSIVGGG